MKEEKVHKIIELLKSINISDDFQELLDAHTKALGIAGDIWSKDQIYYTTLQQGYQLIGIGIVNEKSLILHHTNKDTIKQRLSSTISSMIEQLEAMGLPEHASGKGISINQSVQQKQEQGQEMTLSIFLESIDNELTGKQRKELKDLLEKVRNKSIDEQKESVIDKLKSFGIDVMSNIVANIVTNPEMWSVL